MASTSALTLDDLANSPPFTTPVDISTHLSYPVAEIPELATSENADGPSERQARPLSTERLYIGNLHPSVDEYTLLQIFSKFGKVTKLDFLFHKAGALKGKPRGYAFVEYANQDDAMKALTAAHEKLLRGRKIVVTFAQQAPLDQHGGVIKHRKVMTDAARPTALSMIKTGITSRHEGKTQDKIAILEAKLRQMESSKPQAKSDLPPDGGTSRSSSNSTLPYHPSLPMKPPPQLPSHLLPKSPPSQPTPASKSTLPSLPIGVPNPANTASSKAAPLDYLKTSITRPAAVTTAPPKSGKTAKLLGVKIKPKDPKTKEKSQP